MVISRLVDRTLGSLFSRGHDFRVETGPALATGLLQRAVIHGGRRREEAHHAALAILRTAGLSAERLEPLKKRQIAILPGFGNFFPDENWSNIVAAAYARDTSDEVANILGITGTQGAHGLLKNHGAGVLAWSTGWNREMFLLLAGLDEMVRKNPDRPIDLIGYSKGGFQALSLKALSKIHEKYAYWPEDLKKFFPWLDDPQHRIRIQRVMAHFAQYPPRLIWNAVPPDGIRMELKQSLRVGGAMRAYFSPEVMDPQCEDHVRQVYACLAKILKVPNGDLVSAGLIDGALFGDLAVSRDVARHPLDVWVNRIFEGWLKARQKGSDGFVLVDENQVKERLGLKPVVMIPGVNHVQMFNLEEVAVAVVRLLAFNGISDVGMERQSLRLQGLLRGD